MPVSTAQQIPQELIVQLRSARRIVALTGAGISAESGIPTFRDAQTGLWSRYRPEELATPEAFRANPGLVWDWYQWRRELVTQAEPNAGHKALAALESRSADFLLVTQNVDGLHKRAGSKRLVELHGNLHRAKCFLENLVIEDWKVTSQTPPRCPHCEGPLRPDVVWFGEALPVEALRTATLASGGCDLFFSIGTSSQVHPAASLIDGALEGGATTVEINPDETPYSDRVHHSFRSKAGEFLPQLISAVWPR